MNELTSANQELLHKMTDCFENKLAVTANVAAFGGVALTGVAAYNLTHENYGAGIIATGLTLVGLKTANHIFRNFPEIVRTRRRNITIDLLVQQIYDESEL